MTGTTAMEIPDHEVVTRRRQFRMKKERSENKKNKKDQKKQEKETKQQEKQDKKKAKEMAKAEKAKKKEEEKAQKKKEKKAAKEAEKEEKLKNKKKGRTAKEKTEQGKTASVKKTPKGKKEKKVTEIPEIAQEQCQKHPASTTTEEIHEAVQPAECEGSISQPQTPLPESRVGSPVNSKSGKMKRFKRVSSFWKSGLAPCVLEDRLNQATSDQEKDEEGEDDQAKVDEASGKDESAGDTGTKTGKDTDETAEVEKKTQKKKEQDSGDKTKSKKTGSKSKKQPKKKSTEKKTCKGEKRKADEKQKTKKESETKTKERKPKVPKVPKEEPPANQAAKGLILETIKECATSHCTHPSFLTPSFPDVQCSTYWTRNAVGVKIPKKFVTDKLESKPKSKGKKGTGNMSQVAYFGGPQCKCAYPALITAGIFASRMHWDQKIISQQHVLPI